MTNAHVWQLIRDWCGYSRRGRHNAYRDLAGVPVRVGGHFDYGVLRSGLLVAKGTWQNIATTVGLNHMLDTEYSGGTPITTWYAGLIDNSGFSQVVAGDTMGSHSGWTELTAYSESVRQAWSPGSASGGVKANSSYMNFSANASNTVKGAFLTSNSTKGGTTGTLAGTGTGTGQAVVNLDVLPVRYTKTLTAL